MSDLIYLPEHPVQPKRKSILDELSPLRPIRSYLYIAGHRLDILDSIDVNSADAIVFDLEDLVPDEYKNTARQAVSNYLQTQTESTHRILVRINGSDSPHHDQDIQAVIHSKLTAIRVPKSESVEQIQLLARKIDFFRNENKVLNSIGLQLMIESAEGLKNLDQLVRASHLVWSLGLGEGDLTHDLGVFSDEGLAFARSKLVLASRTANLPPPVQVTALPNITISDLIQNTLLGKSLGFASRSLLNPQHLIWVNQIYNH